MMFAAGASHWAGGRDVAAQMFTEVEMPTAPLSRMAEILFDDLPAALRGSLQVVIAVLIGVLMGNALHLVI